MDDKKEREKIERELDKELEETFPASDPPKSTRFPPGREFTSAKDVEPADDTPPAKDKP